LLTLIAVEAIIFHGHPRWLLMVVVFVATFALIIFGAAIGRSTRARSAGEEVPVDALGLEGHWYGEFGNVYFRVEGNTAKAVYDYNDGRILSTTHDGVLDGWWNELPTRAPSNYAGLVHFEMTRGPRTLRLDGVWLFGRSGNWKTWTLTKVDEVIPFSAQAKLDESSTLTSG
jgi:hypothetical protein